jgi:uncharacterized protein
MTAEAMIDALGLIKHPEGGWYQEMYRHTQAKQQRGDVTTIYFLLDGATETRWHRVTDADEVWCFHSGDPVLLSLEDECGVRTQSVIGVDIEGGQRPQVVVPRGVWQSAASTGAWSLVSCIVAPAFLFESFEMRSTEP